MKPQPGPPRPAPPDDSPRPVLARRLERALLAKHVRSYAGLSYGPDGGLIVYSTGDPALEAAVREIETASGGTVPVRIASGMKNAYAELRALQDEVLARIPEIGSRGIELGGFGVDVIANRLKIGVIGLTPEHRTVLTEMFGAERVLVVEGQRFTFASGSPDR